MNETTLSGRTPDIAEENIAKLREIFPDVFSENKVDFDKLRQVLGEYIEDADERYNFTWNGKSKALHLAQTPSTGTLRPCKEESKDWDTTQNLYIEGDNLEVLKLLQKSYHGKIKMIYIDPPYNTGHDFVYKDDYRDNIQNYLEVTGQLDGEGRKLGTNSESSGRYHTDWLNMMYPRLRLARNLLSDDGVIFISIDDGEAANLKKLCDEIFGEDNFVSDMIWQSRTSISNDHEVSTNHNHTLIYSKYRSKLVFGGDDIDANDYINPDNDPNGPWKLVPIDANHTGGDTVYPIKNPKTGTEYYPPNGRIWCYNKVTLERLLKEGRIKFGLNDDSAPKRKLYYNERIEKGDKKTPSSLILDTGTTKDGTTLIMSLFGNKKLFDYPKSLDFMKRLLKYGIISKDSIILDFFSGSATTAHAVMQLNAEDGGNRRFICVQLPEATDEKSEAYKAGYKNICEIGKERIRRAGAEIEKKNEELKQVTLFENEKDIELFLDIAKHGHEAVERTKSAFKHKDVSYDIDTGFKVFKLDSSNIKKWNPDYDNLEISLLDSVENLVDGRSESDLAYEIMLKYGLDLTYPMDELDCGGKKIYSVGFGMLMICMADDVTTDVAKFIADYKKENEIDEMRVVFKDTCFKDDSTKTNIKEILKCAGVEEFVTV